MMMMMMMNCLCGMAYWRKTFSLISSWDHCQRSSSWRISDTSQTGFETAQNLSSGLVEWSCAVVITTTPWRHGLFFANVFQSSIFDRLFIPFHLSLFINRLTFETLSDCGLIALWCNAAVIAYWKHLSSLFFGFIAIFFFFIHSGNQYTNNHI